MSFSQKILVWYAQHKRPLPWRDTKDPYKIWLSEILLQQTRVAQGKPYYQKFIEQFPTIQDLAEASEQEVLKLWQGLGYYSRARNLHHTAREITQNFEGRFPDTYERLLELKGVGDYTASAIASISFDHPEPVVDGNVFRVLSRYFGVELPIDTGPGFKYFKKLAREVMDTQNIRDYNQGIMEFGAIQCAPKNPNCLACPLNDSCEALEQGKVDKLPVKKGKTRIKMRYFNYLIVLDQNNKTQIRKRKGKGIWQNLYEFPLLESPAEIGTAAIAQRVTEVLDFKVMPEISIVNTKPIVHKLSHQHLYTTFWALRTEEDLEDGISWEEIDQFPVPVLIADFIKTFKKLYF